jgi:Rrf2 family protein
MLRLTKKADYGLMSLKYLAERPELASHSAKDIADAYGIPPQLLAKILQRLTKVGLLRSHAGINGGYALAKSPTAITAFEVIRAIDGPLFITSCDNGLRPCDLNDSCTIKEPLRKVNDSIAEVLKALSIADLCESEEALQRHSARHPSGFGTTLVTLNRKPRTETSVNRIS